MRRLTGSAVGRALACPGSMVYEALAIGDTKWSSMGSGLHGEAEVAVDTGDLSDLPARVAGLIAELPYRHTEVVFVYDAATDTARVLPSVTGRAYPADLGPFEIPMTLDLLALSSATDDNRRAVVVDHKLFADQGDPLHHGQLMTQALAVARVYGLDQVTIAICYLGTGWVDHAIATALDLDMHAERLRQLHLDVASATADPARYTSTGRHCKHCPAFNACPEQVALVARVRADDFGDEIEARIPFGDDDEGAAEMLGFVERVQTLINRARDALSARARERPIPLGGGRFYGPVPTLGNEVLDGDAVYQAAAAFYGRDRAIEFVEVKATKARIKKAAKVVKSIDGKAASVAAVERAVLAEVAKRGGVTRKATGYPLREYTELELIEATKEAEAAAKLLAPGTTTTTTTDEE